MIIGAAVLPERDLEIRVTGIRRVAVIGAGPAGRAFCRRCAHRGFKVTLEDVMPSNLRRAQDEFANDPELEAAGLLLYASTVEDAVREVDIAVDFVPDELESKLEIFSMMDRMAPPQTIFCTPTLALSLTDLASCTYRAAQCAALRCSGTGTLQSPLELVRSRFSAPNTERLVTEFLETLGLQVRTVEDVLEPMLVGNLRRSAAR